MFKYPHLAQRKQLNSSISSSRLAYNEDPGDSNGYQMLGKGVRCRGSNKQQLMEKVQDFVAANASLASGWTQQHVAAAFQQREGGTGVYLYQRFDNAGYEQVSTSSYRQSSSRQNHHVLLQQDGAAGRVGSVKRLLWVRHPDSSKWKGGGVLNEPLSEQQQAQLDSDLRLAVVDVFPVPQNTDGLLRIANKHNTTAGKVYALSQIEAKLVMFEPAGANEVFFASYSNMSKSR